MYLDVFFETFLDWSWNSFPSITLILALLMGCIIATWKVSQLFIRFKTLENLVEQNTHAIVEVGGQVNIVQNQLSSLMVFLKAKHTDFDSKLFVANSPLILTSIGTEILTAIKGKQFIEENYSELEILIDSMAPKTALDVQDSCAMGILQLSRESIFKRIKDYIYHYPEYKINEGKSIYLDMDIISKLMGIYLRDKYLEKHPELLA